MIVANPFGSWVEGARAGQQDAIAMRNAMDEHAMRNYALQREQKFDPYNLQELQARARMGNINADIAEKYGQPMAEANLQQSQFRIPELAAQLGLTGPVLQRLQELYGGAFNKDQFSFPLHGDNNTNVIQDTPVTSIMHPNSAQQMLRAASIYNLGNYRDRTLDLRERGLEDKEGGVNVPGTSIFGSGIPNAAPTPSGGFETRGGSGLSPMVAHTVPAMTGGADPYSIRTSTAPNDVFRYNLGSRQLPAAYYNSGATPPLYNMTGGHKFRPDLAY